MNRTVLVLVAIALSTTVLAGCIGDSDDLDSAIPKAVVKVTKLSDDTFLFDGTGSTGKGLKFEWSLGDGTSATEAKVEHTYVHGDAPYDVELLITDLNGITALWKDVVIVGTGINQPPEALFTPSTRYLAVGEPLTVDATASSDPDDDPILYVWDFNALMDEAEYHQFREDKKEGVTADPSQETEVSDGSNKSTEDLLPSLDELKGVAELGDKSPGHDHGGSTPTVSLFNGARTSEEPVYTLEEGFPEATRFYVKLTAVDVKGASTAILSEEVWPVLVVDTKKKLYYEEEKTGTLHLGAQPTVTDNTPDDENYRDEDEMIFSIPDTIESMFVNVTWSENPAQDALPNDIDVYIISPNGGERSAIATDGKPISIEMTASDGLGSGTWSVKIYGRQGFDIQYVATAWAKVDLDPFRDLDGEYR